MEYISGCPISNVQSAMAFSEILDLLKILRKSMNLVFKKGRSIGLITTVSLLISSLIILLFSYCYQLTHSIIINANANANANAIFSHLLLILFILLSFTAYVQLIRASGLATALASAADDDDVLSLQDLLSLLKSKWSSNSFTNKSRGSMHSMLWMTEMAVAVPIVVFNPNTVTTTVASAVGFSYFVFVGGAAAVIAAEGCACEAAEAVVEGRRVVGLMLNVVFQVVVGAIWLSFRWIVGDLGRLFNLIVYGLFFVNCFSMWNILWSVVYTAYYFQCVEYHTALPDNSSFI